MRHRLSWRIFALPFAMAVLSGLFSTQAGAKISVHRRYVTALLPWAMSFGAPGLASVPVQDGVEMSARDEASGFVFDPMSRARCSAETASPSLKETLVALLHRAATVGDIEAVRILLQAGAEVNAQNESGATPLHEAALNENSEIIRILIEAGAEVSVRDRCGRVPLHWAVAFNESPAVAHILIEAGADVNARDGSGTTPLHGAVGPLYRATREPAVARFLIRAGADVNVRTEAGKWTPLHGAVASTNLAIVRVLLEAGAEVNARDSNGGTPLIWAMVGGGNLAIVTALLEFGADVTVRDDEGKTPFDLAKENGWFKDSPRVLQQLRVVQ